ncbi:M15 family metallopeptidase, partial [Streptomyces sp. NPDC059176]|uniref:M15 family metallopeptidase n=1 Tax=Streptomyces sp. NPDC059176 TaxID=3346758 RepID=UPI0036AF4861
PPCGYLTQSGLPTPPARCPANSPTSPDQVQYFDQYAAGLSAAHPDWPAERIRSAASRYVSPPEVAPHSAGAAVDLTLADADGRELDLGSPVNANPEVSAGACYTQADNISEEARTYRQILASALTAVGMVNYPTEWWHWSFGDRYWALATQSEAAVYGPIEFRRGSGAHSSEPW